MMNKILYYFSNLFANLAGIKQEIPRELVYFPIDRTKICTQCQSIHMNTFCPACSSKEFYFIIKCLGKLPGERASKIRKVLTNGESSLYHSP